LLQRKQMKYQILHGDNRETLKTLADNSIDAIVTDPPYGIDFLGKAWDANTGAVETYQECLRVLKPGGHILAFSAARTYHHLAVTLEQAGFEIRDQIMWIYSSGFPKSQDVGRSIQRSLGVKELDRVVDTTKNAGFGQTDHARVRAGEEWSTTAKQVGVVKCTDPEAQAWEGWGTALKPAHEPIALARKPIKLSIAKNCQTHGVGALNIDATRIPYEDDSEAQAMADWYKKYPVNQTGGAPTFAGVDKPKAGRRTASFHNATGGGETQSGGDGSGGWEASQIGRFPSNVLGEIPDYQKYFYCPKVSRRERHIGFDYAETNKEMCASIGVEYKDNETTLPGIGMVKDHGLRQEIEKIRGYSSAGNNHPTVKPIELMKYLIRLITPEGGTVLDPFNGSGSTGCAAVELGMTYIGCELDAKYVDIASRRIEAWYEHCNPTTYNQLFEQAA
jgi:DNA modification methylase